MYIVRKFKKAEHFYSVQGNSVFMTTSKQFNSIVSVIAIKVECDPFHKCLYCRTKVRLNFIGKGINQRMGVHKITANKQQQPVLAISQQS